jgi:hypothetical protein
MKRFAIIIGMGLLLIIGTLGASTLFGGFGPAHTVHAAASHRSASLPTSHGPHLSAAVFASRDALASARTLGRTRTVLQARRVSGLHLMQRLGRGSGTNRYAAGSRTGRYMRYAAVGHTGHNCPNMTSTRTGK